MALTLSGSVTPYTEVGHVPDTPGGCWVPAFPSTDLVDAATGMFTGYRLADRKLGITLDGLRVDTPSGAKGRELFPPRDVPMGSAGQSHWPARYGAPARAQLDHELEEGPRWRVLVSPGTVAVRSTDPARSDRTYERLLRTAIARQNSGAEPVESGASGVTSWSPKSRARMVETMQALDWSPFFDQPDANDVPAMVTLTYPGDWLAVAPDATTSRGHLLRLRKRYERAWRRRMITPWKREFQRRGAPHYHLLLRVPSGLVQGEPFRDWLSRTWADIVGAACCSSDAPCDPAARCEYHAHRLAGTGVDYAEGSKATDPRRISVYFSKHGAWAAKDYQNDAPEEWIESGSVGRFWGIWGLDKAVAGVEIAPSEARAALRVLRRHSRANSYQARVPVFRYRTRVEPETGEVWAVWRKSTKKRRMYQLRNAPAGFIAHPNGPALAASVARALDAQFRPPGVIVGNSGAGPVGFLP